MAILGAIVVAVLVPVAIVILGSLARFFIEQRNEEYQYFFCGIELTVAAIAEVVSHITEIWWQSITLKPVEHPTDKSGTVAMLALFGFLAFLLLLHLMRLHKKWGDVKSSNIAGMGLQRRHLLWESNLIGGVMLFIALVIAHWP